MTGPSSSERYDVVAVASSAGGIPALGTLLAAFGPDLPVPVLVVQHLDRHRRTSLARILARRTTLAVRLASDQEQIEPGVVYVAPPDHHLLVEPGGVLALTTSELVHFVRPSADLLFESVAGTYGWRAIACVLTGTGSDGALGVQALKSRGGTVVIEDPHTAAFDGMPNAAVATGTADYIVPLAEIGAVICGLLATSDDKRRSTGGR
ncbi:chemotaxis protein CheB [Nocardia sp. BMG51109]|uniref:chemotaxis protein CheB n=1 Tax=Nocardia sp. BMG51109 TaxID=1056816 RepID=UPI000467E012|nr:chemotaxis protein CheB [Nocardia sp. BMG51109]